MNRFSEQPDFETMNAEAIAAGQSRVVVVEKGEVICDLRRDNSSSPGCLLIQDCKIRLDDVDVPFSAGGAAAAALFLGRR